MSNYMDRITIYPVEGGFRWTRRNAHNGKVVGASTQVYNDERDARHNIETTQGGQFVIYSAKADA